MTTTAAGRFTDLGHCTPGGGAAGTRPSTLISFALVVMSFSGGVVFGEFARLVL